MKIKALVLVALLGVFTACGGGEESKDGSGSSPVAAPAAVETPVAEEVDPMENVGIGPIDELEFDEEVDMDLAAAGEAVFNSKCSACHKTNKRYIGPSPQGIYDRRNPAWVMNMILNPDEMTQKDPIAKDLLAEYSSPMANQNLTIDEAREIVEYFRTLEP